ncbi:MAG TPA: 30S ribosomal protein S5 [Candidatus Uhrbacteria bacterium]|nr:30S ribosomal protein S5 [Candidatus Uhrbacteria bacterium]
MNRRSNKEILKKEEEFEQRIIDVARVTRVMAGGKRMKFRVCLAIGDKKGRIGMGIAKGADVTQGVTKALAKAKKNLIKVPIVNETIPHAVNYKFKAAKILLKPAKKGAGIKAGGPLRILCELSGIPNITGKILGSNNKINITRASLEAFSSFKPHKKGKDLKAVDEKNHTTEKEVSGAGSDNKNPSKNFFKDKIKGMINKKDK